MAETQIETISINGQAQPYQPQTLSELLAVSGVDVAQPGIAVALNARVIRRAEWATTALQPGDRVELVQARAGG